MTPRTLLFCLPLLAACHGATHADETTVAPEPATAATPVGDAPHATADNAPREKVGTDPGNVGDGTPLTPKAGHALAAFAGGCFWGTEDAFRKVRGVTATAVGYTGGHTEHPDYDKVCEHDTGHAETVLVEFDPAKISYEKLLKVFFAIHDPTQMNRQGPDEGDQYRSEVFTFDDAQKAAAKKAIADLQPTTSKPIVTRVEPISKFYRAEDYHQHYAERTGHHGCPIGKIPDGI